MKIGASKGLLAVFIVSLLGTVVPAKVHGQQRADILIVQSIEGEAYVESSREAGAWVPLRLGSILPYGARVRTGIRGRLSIRYPNGVVLFVDRLSLVEVGSDNRQTAERDIDLKQGALYFFSRRQSERRRLIGPAAIGAIKGTEFEARIVDNDTLRISMIDGEVDLSNEAGLVELEAGEVGFAGSGGAPRKAKLVSLYEAVQWCLYYPAVIDPAVFDAGLGEPLSRYRRGDLPGAMAAFDDRYPGGGDSASSRLLGGALLLASGDVEGARQALSRVSGYESERRALEELIDAVGGVEAGRTSQPQSASHWLARSYWRQSQDDLEGALAAARRATEMSPNFGYAWVRRAEMEFAFGQTTAMKAPLEQASGLVPENPQVAVLRGLVAASENNLEAAGAAFQQSIAKTGELGHAWLGLGLVQRRSGDLSASIDSVETAAATEPSVSSYRSYLARLYDEAGRADDAANELQVARELDPGDPTPHLVSALLNQRQNRINQAIRDLERSIELNDNRSLFRSRSLLDQDYALRRANLAAIYRDAGMEVFGRREAARALVDDPANHSAYLFLASAYEELRDPNRFNLRYETVVNQSLLMANLLASVEAGVFSRHVGLNDYTKLLGDNGLSLLSQTDYWSRGAWSERASITYQGGTQALALDLDYYRSPGWHPNGDIERYEVGLTYKFQVTPRDTVTAHINMTDRDSGDASQLYDPADGDPVFRFEEEHMPDFYAGWTRNWSPDATSLLMAGRWRAEVNQMDEGLPLLALYLEPDGGFLDAFIFDSDLDFESEQEFYVAELQHIQRWGSIRLLAGARYQTGEISSASTIGNFHPSTWENLFEAVPFTSTVEEDLERISGYAYVSFEPVPEIKFTVGVTADEMDLPKNFLLVPVTGGSRSISKISPKVGIDWRPLPSVQLRAAYLQGLGGASFEESIRLEPTIFHGFLQGFRSLLPESAVSSVSGPEFEVFGGGISWSGPHDFYLDLSWAERRSEALRYGGFIDYRGVPGASTIGLVADNNDFEERELELALHKLIGDSFTAGLRYRFIEAEYRNELLFDGLDSSLRGDSTLQVLTAQLGYQHPAGWMARLESSYLEQENDIYSLPDEDLFQTNVILGYRMPGRRIQLQVGVLNVEDEDYRLFALTPFLELPRERTFFASVKIEY